MILSARTEVFDTCPRAYASAYTARNNRLKLCQDTQFKHAFSKQKVTGVIFSEQFLTRPQLVPNQGLVAMASDRNFSSENGP